MAEIWVWIYFGVMSLLTIGGLISLARENGKIEKELEEDKRIFNAIEKGAKSKKELSGLSDDELDKRMRDSL